MRRPRPSFPDRATGAPRLTCAVQGDMTPPFRGLHLLQVRGDEPEAALRVEGFNAVAMLDTASR